MSDKDNGEKEKIDLDFLEKLAKGHKIALQQYGISDQIDSFYAPDPDSMLELIALARAGQQEGKPVSQYQQKVYELSEEIRDLRAQLASAQRDAKRLDFMAYHSTSLHIDPKDGRRFLSAPYHTGIACIDDHQRFDTTREAIDAASAQLTNSTGGEA